MGVAGCGEQCADSYMKLHRQGGTDQHNPWGLIPTLSTTEEREKAQSPQATEDPNDTRQPSLHPALMSS